MATPFRIKRSAVPGKAPAVSDLQLGELALNTYDAELYTLRSRPGIGTDCLLYTSPSPRDRTRSRMPSSA